MNYLEHKLERGIVYLRVSPDGVWHCLWYSFQRCSGCGGYQRTTYIIAFWNIHKRRYIVAVKCIGKTLTMGMPVRVLRRS